jgi:TatA/E family protein of Tat protein translocase
MHLLDSVFIFMLALVLFGPKKLPEMARQLGKLMAEFRRASNEFKLQMDEELRVMDQHERQKKLETAATQQVNTLAAPEATAQPVIMPPATGVPVSSGFALGSWQSNAESSGNGTSEKGTSEPAPISEAAPSFGLFNGQAGIGQSGNGQGLDTIPAEPHPAYVEALAAEAREPAAATEPENAQATVHHG